jgi:hypothetical protein
MKKILIIAAIVAIVVAGVAIAAAGNQGMNHGPAPNSGDCIPDGSGFASFDGQGPGYGPGPAPNSGDGVPDGPGW